MIYIEKVDNEGTLALVVDYSTGAGMHVSDALRDSDWEDCWEEDVLEASKAGMPVVHMLFDKNDQAAILKLLNAHDELNVERVRA